VQDLLIETQQSVKVLKAELDTNLEELRKNLNPTTAKIYMEIKTKERLPRALRWLKAEKEKKTRELKAAYRAGKSGYEEKSFIKYYRKGIRRLRPLLKVNQESNIGKLIHAYACGLFEGELWEAYEDILTKQFAGIIYLPAN